jgi:hypothetical protein
MTNESRVTVVALLALLRDDNNARQAMSEAARRRIPEAERTSIALILDTSSADNRGYTATAALGALVADVQGAQ